MRRVKIAQIQSHVYGDKEKNLKQAEAYLAQMAPEKPDLVALGEMFACPYDTANFPVVRRGGGRPHVAGAAGHGGEVRRLAGGGLCAGAGRGREDLQHGLCVRPQGRQAAKHRKVHLFDIQVEGGQHFRESDTLTPGRASTVFDTEFGKIGLCVCFDFRFPELALRMARDGARLILVPAAFNMTTGPAHWELMFRSRAVDGQCFAAGISPARG